MKPSLTAWFVAAMLLAGLTAYSQVHGLRSGVYTGLEKKTSLTPWDADVEWYHENELRIKEETIFLEKSPVSIDRKSGEKTYSAADGGFFYYEGRLIQKKTKIFVNLKMTNCDYCMRPLNQEVKSEEHEILLSDDGSFSLNGVRYTYKEKTE